VFGKNFAEVEGVYKKKLKCTGVQIFGLGECGLRSTKRSSKLK